MSDKTIPAAIIVKPAPNGSKADWVNVSGEVPLALRDELDEVATQTARFRTDLVKEGVELVIEKYRGERRRVADRRQSDRKAS